MAAHLNWRRVSLIKSLGWWKSFVECDNKNFQTIDWSGFEFKDPLQKEAQPAADHLWRHSITEGTAAELLKLFSLREARHSPALPVAAEGDRHSDSSRLVVTLSLPQPGARHSSGGPVPCLPPNVTDSDSDYRQPPECRHSLLSGPGTQWQLLRVAVTHRDCGHSDLNPGPAFRHSKHLRVW